jgi:hypothetical protein
MYKCTKDGVITYQSSSCEASSGQNLIEDKSHKKDLSTTEVLEEGVDLSSLTIKIDTHDALGNDWITYSTDVTNKTASYKKVYVKYHAIDSNGLSLKELLLADKVPPHSIRTLSDNELIKSGISERINKWQLDREFSKSINLNN